MQHIEALSLAPAVNDWLDNTRHPRILHVFERACNLINERREVLSIVTTEIGNGPFNLVFEEDILFSDHLDVQSSIAIHADQLHLDDLTIHTAEAKLWQPRPDWEMLHASRDHILDQLMILSLPDHQPSIPNTQALRLRSGQASNLSSEIADADISSAKTTTSQLAGLGIGLTPTGDDFIIGAVYAARIIHPPENASLLAQEITNTAAPLTTSLSAAWLRSAGKGEAWLLWHQFFDALVTGGEVEFYISKILAVGETSGADALLGFFGVCTAYKERIIDPCPS